MLAFVTDSGVEGGAAPCRYLWTDAYAVSNLLALHQESGDEGYLQLARSLVKQVHEVLGRHRADDSREGWLSGLDDAGARVDPTCGGLRIGKPLPERGPHDRYDEQTEWDRDGQYYHYLTKWVHALHQMQRAAEPGDEPYGRWARSLLIAATQRFRLPGGQPRLAWKMSIDLSRPLVDASGQHDPLDGLVTALVLRADEATSELESTARELALMCRSSSWLTDDTLGLGGLLFDICRLAQLSRTAATDSLLLNLLSAVRVGLERLHRDLLRQPAQLRLGFRELGLAIGLKCLALIDESRRAASAEFATAVGALEPYVDLATQIESFWCDQANRQHASWQQHRNISDVMLAATLLAPAVGRI